MALPTFKLEDTAMDLLQRQWKSQLDPVLANPVTNPVLLSGIALAAGDNVINHLLGRKLQGWILTDTTAASTLYRSAPKNSKTLTLNASVPTTIDLIVF